MSKKLSKNDELLVTGFAGTRLKMELDRVPLWKRNNQRRGSEAARRGLRSRYVYLPQVSEGFLGAGRGAQSVTASGY